MAVPSASTLGVFVVACLVFLAVPGPSVLYILAQSLEHGRRGGLAAVLGIHLGTVVHVVVAAGGILIGLGVLSDGTYALLGGTAGGWFRRRPRVVARERYLTGAVYIGLGVVAAIAGHHRKS